MQKGSIVRELKEDRRYFIVREIEETTPGVPESTLLYCRQLDQPLEVYLTFHPTEVEELDPVDVVKLRQTKEFSHLTVI